MTLLREIQEGAIGSDSSVAALLRRCTVLAARLHHVPLRDWVTLESSGYPPANALPSYRPKVHTQVLGTFAGPFGSGAENLSLPKANVPEEYRDWLFTTEIRQSVAEIEGLLNSGETHFQISWPADVVVILREKFMQDMALMAAHQVVPATSLEGTLSGIRDRIVQFALEIEEIDPGAGEAKPGQTPIEQGRVTQIFNQTFHGDNTAFAAAGHTVNQTQTARVDVEAVRQAADAFGISEADRDALLTAVEGDGGFAGERTREWIDRLKAGGIAVGTGVTTQTAAAALLGVLGLS